MSKRLVPAVMLTMAVLAALAQTPAPGSASVRISGSSLGRIRVGAADPNIWFGWKVGIPARLFPQLTFSEAAAKADTLGLGSIEGSNIQKVSFEIPKLLDYRLAAGERTAISNRLRDLNVRMVAYHVDRIPADEDSRRKLFEFAKSLGVEMILCAPDAALLPELDKLANEYGVNVALRNSARKDDPKSLLAALEGRSKHIGISADLAAWVHAGVKPMEALPILTDRLVGFNVAAPGGLADFFLQAFRLELKPLFITIDSGTGADAYADLSRSIDAFEKAMQPAMAARVAQMADSPAGAIRGPDRLKPEYGRKSKPPCRRTHLPSQRSRESFSCSI